MNTMPQVITAMTQVWIDRLYRLRGVRNMPSVNSASSSQTATSASNIDVKRGSSPLFCRSARIWFSRAASQCQ